MDLYVDKYASLSMDLYADKYWPKRSMRCGRYMVASLLGFFSLGIWGHNWPVMWRVPWRLWPWVWNESWERSYLFMGEAYWFGWDGYFGLLNWTLRKVHTRPWFLSTYIFFLILWIVKLSHGLVMAWWYCCCSSKPTGSNWVVGSKELHAI